MDLAFPSAPDEETDTTEPSPVDEEAQPVVAAPFLSEGVRHDLEMHGKATDPASGGVFTKDNEAGKVSFTDRTGNVTEL